MAISMPAVEVPAFVTPPLGAPPLGAPTPLPAGISQPMPQIGGRGTQIVLLTVGILAVAAGIGATIWFSTQGPAPEAKTQLEPTAITVIEGSPTGCAQLRALAGSWVFTTTTTGSRRKQKPGTRGFYEMQIDVDAEACTARASMAKTGRTDRKVFVDHKVPRAEADLVRGEGAEAYGWTGPFMLRNEDDQGIDTKFVFALDGERLVGSWRQLGERWNNAGLYGVLEGRRAGDPIELHPDRNAQPCSVRCATPEDIAQIDTPDETTLRACMASCK
ncbi:flagellar basal body-associated FliL family protein [Paraliomyxa miuraensis]|uniref:hypothetical protein n=1 Tax=Paraliomyxa miuraensis TaxID=376150 RepID=UPI002251067E|nr:hypothetical protein [Paraliomyxa miuraensis]